MRSTLILMLLLIASGFGLDRNDIYLRAGLRGGIPQGIGASARISAYLLNMEAGANYGYYLNTLQMGMGFRLPVGERNEFFWNIGWDEVYSHAFDLNLSQGFWSELQYERLYARGGITLFASLGAVVYPEDNEKNIGYGLPILRLGFNKEILGF